MRDYSHLSDDELMAAAGISSNKAPTSQALDLNTLSDEELFNTIGIKNPKERGFLDKVDSALSARNAQVMETNKLAAEGRITPQQELLRNVGAGFGGVQDVVGQGIASAARTGYEALPEFAQKGLVSVGKSILNTKAGQDAIRLAKQGGENWETFKRLNPAIAPDIEAALNIGTAITPIPGIGKSAVGIAKEGVKLGGEGVEQAVKATGEKALSTLAPKISPETAKLANRAKDFDIPLRADQITDSRVRNTIQKIGQELPFSGDEAFEAKQKSSWNKGVAGTLGEQDLTPESINNFIKRNSDDFNSVLAGKQVEINNDVFKNLEEAKLKKTADTKSAIDDYIKDIKNNTKNGFIDGNVLNALRSDFLKDLTQKTGDVKQGLGQILDTLDNVIDKNLSPEEAAKIAQARNQYRNFKTIEPLLEKVTDGEINPTLLLNRVAASKYIKASRKSVGQDDLVDLARIGKEFLPKKAGSDTFQKGVYGAGTFGLGGSVFNPSIAPAVAASYGLSRAAQGLNRNQKLIEKSIQKSLPKDIGKLPPREAQKILNMRKK